MVADLIGGQVQAAFDNLPVSIPYIKNGKLRALGVAAAQRWPASQNLRRPAMPQLVCVFSAVTVDRSCRRARTTSPFYELPSLGPIALRF